MKKQHKKKKKKNTIQAQIFMTPEVNRIVEIYQAEKNISLKKNAINAIILEYNKLKK